MRIGLISDVHGNTVALDAVLAALRDAGVDRTICLGDVAYGPCPHEALQRVREACDVTVAGNGETWLADPGAVHRERLLQHPRFAGMRSRHAAALDWARDRLTPDDLDHMRQLPMTYEVELPGGRSLLCFHGSPRHNYDLIFATTPARDLDALFDGHRATVMASGHSHQQMLRRHRDFTLVNVGSVGRSPRHVPWPAWFPVATELADGPGDPDEYRTDAEYAILTATETTLGVEFRSVGLDVDALVAMIDASGIPAGRAYLGLGASR